MRHMDSHPGKYRKIFLANYLRIGFVPGGSLQVWLIGIEILASKSKDAYQGQAPREIIAIFFSKIGVDLGIWVGVDVSWIFGQLRKKG